MGLDRPTVWEFTKLKDWWHRREYLRFLFLDRGECFIFLKSTNNLEWEVRKMVSVVVTVKNFQQKEILEINRPNCVFSITAEAHWDVWLVQVQNLVTQPGLDSICLHYSNHGCLAMSSAVLVASQKPLFSMGVSREKQVPMSWGIFCI